TAAGTGHTPLQCAPRRRTLGADPRLLRFLGLAESLALGFATRALFLALTPRFFAQPLALGVSLGTQPLALDLFLGLEPVALGFLFQPLRLFLGLALFLLAYQLGLARAPLSFLLFLLLRQLPLPLGDPLRGQSLFFVLLGGELANPSSLPFLFEPGLLARPLRQRSGLGLGLLDALLLFGAQGLLLLVLLRA